MAITLPASQLVVPTETTQFRHLGKELREFGESLDKIYQNPPPSLKGDPGPAGRGISSITTTYAASTSGTTAPTSGWSSTIPSVPAGRFLWTRLVTSYTSGSNTTAYSVARQGADGSGGTTVPDTGWVDLNQYISNVNKEAADGKIRKWGPLCEIRYESWNDAAWANGSSSIAMLPATYRPASGPTPQNNAYTTAGANQGTARVNPANGELFVLRSGAQFTGILSFSLLYLTG